MPRFLVRVALLALLFLDCGCTVVAIVPEALRLLDRARPRLVDTWRAPLLSPAGGRSASRYRPGPRIPRRSSLPPVTLSTDSGRALREDGTDGEGPDGVVCPTWLQPDIQKKQLRNFLRDAGVSPEGFISETARLCGGSAGPAAGAYTGSWKDHEPSENDLRILHGLMNWTTRQRQLGSAKALTWDNFSNSDNGRSTAAFIGHAISHPTSITAVGTRRILDFGCGSGVDIAALSTELSVKKEDALCLDIFRVPREDVTAIVLDASSDEAYRQSLSVALTGNAGTVHVAISFVTFHHIRRTQRHDAFAFLSQVLAPGGLFLMAEWDNSVKPDRWIHYDLVHILSGVLFAGGVPQDPEDLRIGTEYLSVHSWIIEAERGGRRPAHKAALREQWSTAESAGSGRLA